jgi:hypothetical protein
MTVTKQTWFLETGFGSVQLVHDPDNGDRATLGDKFGFFFSVIGLVLWTLFRTFIWLAIATLTSYDLFKNPSHWWDWILIVIQFFLFYRCVKPVKFGSDKFGLTTTEDDK